MSTVNVTTLYTASINANNLLVGNSVSNQTISSNSTSLYFGSNVIITNTSIYAGNATHNTTITTSGITTNSIILNGSTYTTIPSAQTVSNVTYYSAFTTTGWNTWTKPTNLGANDIITLMLWGGGGSGYGISGQSGGGGACVIVNLLASQCNATCNVYVASGGNSSAGQTSVFWTNSTFSISAYGGGPSQSTSSGGGGGIFSVGTTNGGRPLGGSGGGASTFGGGGGGAVSAGGVSVYGGGGGGTASGGNSYYGGAGGTNSGAVATSVFGGNGANNTTAATAPGGGGAGTATYAAGARGEVRVWVTRIG